MTIKILQKKGKRWTKDQKAYELALVCDASGKKRYLSIFQDKFKFIEIQKVYEFCYVTLGYNGMSLSVGWNSTCTGINDRSIEDIFEDFEVFDVTINGQIAGLSGFSIFISCSNCQSGIRESEAFCKNCKKQGPTGEETFR